MAPGSSPGASCWPSVCHRSQRPGRPPSASVSSSKKWLQWPLLHGIAGRRQGALGTVPEPQEVLSKASITRSSQHGRKQGYQSLLPGVSNEGRPNQGRCQAVPSQGKGPGQQAVCPGQIGPHPGPCRPFLLKLTVTRYRKMRWKGQPGVGRRWGDGAEGRRDG